MVDAAGILPHFRCWATLVMATELLCVLEFDSRLLDSLFLSTRVLYYRLRLKFPGRSSKIKVSVRPAVLPLWVIVLPTIT
jgi:hypothetical protein